MSDWNSPHLFSKTGSEAKDHFAREVSMCSRQEHKKALKIRQAQPGNDPTRLWKRRFFEKDMN